MDAHHGKLWLEGDLHDVEHSYHIYRSHYTIFYLLFHRIFILPMFIL